MRTYIVEMKFVSPAAMDICRAILQFNSEHTCISLAVLHVGLWNKSADLARQGKLRQFLGKFLDELPAVNVPRAKQWATSPAIAAVTVHAHAATLIATVC